MRKILTMIAMIFCAGQADAETLWERYLVNPTAENAKTVPAIEYSSNEGRRDFDIHMLQTQVVSGDVEALRLTIRIASQSDGGDLHDLLVIISRSIRSHPDNFVNVSGESLIAEELLKRAAVKAGAEYIDRPRAREYEFQERISAIKGVRDSPFPNQQKMLVEILQRAIDDL